MKEPGLGGASGAGREGGQGGGGVWDIVLLNPNRYPEAGTRRLRPWLERLVSSLVPAAAAGEERSERSLGVRFTGDREMRRVNRGFRGKDKTTDVLSFPGEEEHLGDILISVPTARRQAAEAGHPVERELKVLLLHGLLHCMGYDHETDDGTMERVERKLRRAWIPAEDPSPPGPLSHPLPPTGRGGKKKGGEGAPLSRRAGGGGRGDGGEGSGHA